MPAMKRKKKATVHSAYDSVDTWILMDRAMTLELVVAGMLREVADRTEGRADVQKLLKPLRRGCRLRIGEMREVLELLND